MIEMWKDWLEITIFNNTVKDYALAVFNLVALVIVLMLSKRLLVGRLGKLAAKTANDFDDFMVSLLAQVGAPVFIVTSLYFVTLPLHLEDQVRTIIRYVLIIIVTVRAVLVLQEIVKYSIGKSYRRARPNDKMSGDMVAHWRPSP